MSGTPDDPFAKYGNGLIANKYTNDQFFALEPWEQAQIKEQEAAKEKSRNASSYNPDGANVEYGGPGGFAGAAQDQIDRVNAARGREGYQYNEQQYGEARAQAEQARGQQQQGLGMLRDQMDLSQSSAASRAVIAGGQQAQGAQSSLASVARGGAMGQIAARTQAARGNINLGQQAAGQANVVRQQEAQRAALAYGQQASAMRAGDAASLAQEAQAAEDRNQSKFQNVQQNAARERGAQGIRDAILGTQSSSAQTQDVNQSKWQQNIYDIQNGDGDKAAARNDANVAGAAGLAEPVVKLGLDRLGGNAAAPAERSDREKRDDDNEYSDERLKRGARHISEASELARSTPGYAYKYKAGVPGESPEDQQYGVMAQDLEKTPMGKVTVKNTPTGKQVDTKKLTMVHQAMFHDMQKQIDQLKGARK